jgi:hypothetical protein
MTVKSVPGPLVPRVTPDPNAAAALQRRLDALKYYPTNGFHRDIQQPKKAGGR